MKHRAWRWIADRRDIRAMKVLAHAASGYLNAFSAHDDYILSLNGEERVVRIISSTSSGGLFIDVGANVGDWTELVVRHVSGSSVIAFEPGSSAREALEARFQGHPQVAVIPAAATDANGTASLFVPVGDTVVASLDPSLMKRPANPERRIVEEEVETVSLDTFCDERGIRNIAMVKIDVEGSDYKVLLGAHRLFSEQRVAVASFEYSKHVLKSRFLLADFFEFFNGFGYEVGRIYPRSVTFGPYKPEFENFRMQNFLAVREDLSDLRQELARVSRV